MKDARSHQCRKNTTTCFLATLIIISVMASLVGCTPAFCADDNAGKTLLERFGNIADQAAQAAQKAGDALDSAVEAVIGAMNLPQITTQPTDDFLPPPEWNDPEVPDCPPFEEELGRYHTYEELDVFLDQTEQDFLVDIYGLYIYALAPTDFPFSVMKEELRRVYGLEASHYEFETVGQFYIDGEDWVPVYKLIIESRDYTHIWYNLTDGNYSYYNEDGSYVSGFQVFFGEWENTDVSDEDADCWKALAECENTDEYKRRFQEMLDTICQMSGMTVSEMDNDEHFTMRRFMFADNVCDMDGNVFSVYCMWCRYDPVPPQTEEAAPAAEPSEPATEQS